jgi:IclR family pca regulon transcriptional regulator
MHIIEQPLPAESTSPQAVRGRQKSSDARFAFVRSLERGLEVIKSFGEGRPEQTIADVASRTGVDRSTARRFLLTLSELGYIEKNGRSFRLSPQTLQLGYAYLSSLPWWRFAQREAERLRDKVGQNCAVGVLDRDQVVYVAYASAAPFPLVNRSLGIHLPAFSTAIGRILIAHLGDEQARNFLRRSDIKKLTPFTLVDRDAITEVFADIRALDYAYVDQELEIGLRSVGVPIRDRSGHVVAALSISFVSSELNKEQIAERYLPNLRDTTRNITEMLPY